jgi:hypothetical protein
MKRFHNSQRVFVKQDEDGTIVNRHGTVTRICTDGERAWVLLDAKGGGAGSDKVRCYPDDCEPPDVANRTERRAAGREASEPPITIDVFGQDHWSTFAYIETCVVDHGGRPSRHRMRCHAGRHPALVGAAGDASGCPTRLRGERTLTNHDDWDCCVDLEREGLLETIGTGVDPVFKLTPMGREVAVKLRQHKADGGSFSTFAIENA